MSGLELRDPRDCAFDVVSLGEVMLRLDPGEGRIRNARSFAVWEGGGEYNVARALSACFGLRAAVVTGLVDSEVGRLVESLIRAGGVDTGWIQWRPYDGIGAAARVGLNFTERGYGPRAALGISDRARSATSLLAPGDVDWDDLFGRAGVRWLHTGGICAALGPASADLVAEAMATARRHGTVVSYDSNYRPSLWAALGGVDRARAVNRDLAGRADVLFGFPSAIGGIQKPRTSASLSVEEVGEVLASVAADLPNLTVVATSVRRDGHTSAQRWGGVAWSDSHATVSPERDVAVLDRIGGGDAFAAGVVFGLLTGQPINESLELGVAHGALAMTTPGDGSMASLDEVRSLAAGLPPRAIR